MGHATDLVLLERLKLRIRIYRFQCQCGTTGNTVQLTKHGRPWAQCKNAGCGRRIFWNRPEKFLETDPGCRHYPPLRPTKKRGMLTSWCPECMIRVFERASSANPLS